jgi:hypothetical protein
MGARALSAPLGLERHQSRLPVAVARAWHHVDAAQARRYAYIKPQQGRPTPQPPIYPR